MNRGRWQTNQSCFSPSHYMVCNLGLLCVRSSRQGALHLLLTPTNCWPCIALNGFSGTYLKLTLLLLLICWAACKLTSVRSGFVSDIIYKCVHIRKECPTGSKTDTLAAHSQRNVTAQTDSPDFELFDAVSWVFKRHFFSPQGSWLWAYLQIFKCEMFQKYIYSAKQCPQATKCLSERLLPIKY